jgi:hypothetical protein
MVNQSEAVQLLVDLLLKDVTKIPVPEVHKLSLRRCDYFQIQMKK